MDLDLNKEQKILKRSAQDFLKKECPPSLIREMKDDERGYPRELWDQMVELGWPGVMIPEEYGGIGGSYLDLCILLEAMGAVCCPGPFFFVENGHIADYLICAARTDSEAGSAAGLTLFLIDAKSPGIQCTSTQTLGYERHCELIFDNVRVPEANVLGEVDQAFEILENLQEKAAVAKCAELVGCIQTAFDMTVKYAKERKQFGRPIGSFQAMQHHCANMVVDVDGSRFMTYQAAWRIAEGLPASREAAMAKAWTSDASRRVTSLAHQIHGAISFTEEYDVHLFYRRAKAGEVAFGDTEYHLERVAQELGL